MALTNTPRRSKSFAADRRQLIQHDMLPFLRDVYDHAARGLDLVEMQRDLATGALDIYLSSVANRTNNVMEDPNDDATVTLPILLVTSFYGMNLKHLPSAHHRKVSPWSGS